MAKYLLLFCIALTGCASESLDKPSPERLLMWTKPGGDTSQVLIDAFDCYTPSTYTINAASIPRDVCMRSKGYSLTPARWENPSNVDYPSDVSECSRWGFNKVMEYLSCPNTGIYAGRATMDSICQMALLRGRALPRSWSWEADPTSPFWLCMASKDYTAVPIDG